eukprot:CAMPEP_0173404908 /NCGR_PEP_ID=MMETSP1356-20130122/60595_1 /TAXON_ID=77927 ORGANISM="Hemiselmis virescens, Strain PCC157" /NCGR_SAMPLE_ID=MMETSP1356 /ASSEMBLY_ACC=CAM_ASM_000847 /LENGTH=118 /DNA_ID=CAMNT_0014365649 /DNA_START=1 /DNA_END=354 /DNA_ORIENTATION=-
MQSDIDRLASADYLVSAQLQSSPAASAAGGGAASPAVVQILLDVRSWSPPQHVAVTLKPGVKQWVWSLDRVSNGSSSQVAEHGDRQFKPNTFQAVKVAVRGSRVSVTCDGRAVFSDVD